MGSAGAIKFQFPAQYHEFHKDQVFNFQLNRWYSLGYARLEEMQIQALTNAKSVTARIFTKEDQAHNHCQIGNIGLALDVMMNWIDRVSSAK